MSNEETITAMAASGDAETKAALMLELFSNNAPLVNRALKPFAYYADMEDLRQEAFLALYRIVEHYNPERGKFTTYLTNVLPGIIRARLNETSAVRLPPSVLERVDGVTKELRALEQKLGRAPTEAEILEGLDIHPVALREALEADRSRRPVSIEKPLTDSEEPDTLADTLPDPFVLEDSIIDVEAAKEMSAELWEAVADLPEKNREAVIAVCVNGQTLEEVAQADGVSRETIRQRKERGLRILNEQHGQMLRRVWAESEIFAAALQGNSVQTFRRSETSSTERVALMIMGEI